MIMIYEVITVNMLIRSVRMIDFAVKMKGNSNASYKRLKRFAQRADSREALWRLFQEQAEFVIGDPTDQLFSKCSPTSCIVDTGPSTHTSFSPMLQRPHLPNPQCMRASRVT